MNLQTLARRVSFRDEISVYAYFNSPIAFKMSSCALNEHAPGIVVLPHKLEFDCL